MNYIAQLGTVKICTKTLLHEWQYFTRVEKNKLKFIKTVFRSRVWGNRGSKNKTKIKSKKKLLGKIKNRQSIRGNSDSKIY